MADTQQRIRVFCVDDHRVMLDGLALLIGRQPDMEVVGSATHGEQAVDSVARMKPDVTLMDLQLPGSERAGRDPPDPEEPIPTPASSC